MTAEASALRSHAGSLPTIFTARPELRGCRYVFFGMARGTVQFLKIRV